MTRIVAVILAVAALGTAAGAVAQPVRIMPLGNSITSGTEARKCYRRYLDHLLHQGGRSFNFVGSLRKCGAENVDPNPADFDLDHEGWWGKEVDWMLEYMTGWGRGRFVTARPNIVLCELGTNDILHETEKDSADTVIERTLRELEELIDTMRHFNSSTRFLLGTLIPVGQTWPDGIGVKFRAIIPQFNTRLPEVIANRSTAQSPVILVDVAEGFNWQTDMTDSYHPNEAGAEKMAAQWYAALEAVLNPTPVILSYPRGLHYREQSRSELILYAPTFHNVAPAAWLFSVAGRKTGWAPLMHQSGTGCYGMRPATGN